MHGRKANAQVRYEKQLSFFYPNMINHVSWFHKCLDHKMLFGFVVFLKAWLGELEQKAFIFSPYLNVFSFQCLQDQMSLNEHAVRKSTEDKLL